MEANKLFFSLAFVMSLVLTVPAPYLSVNYGKRDYIFGKKKDSDKALLLNARAHAHADLFTHHILKQVFYVPPPKPEPGQLKPPPTPIISQILVEDQGTGSKSCKILDGGPGYTFVRLRLKSHLRKKLEYLVTLYGHPPSKNDTDSA